MRDYWLTQYILSAIGWEYLIIVLIALGLALWLVNGKIAKTITALISVAKKLLVALKLVILINYGK